MNILELAIRS